VAAVQGAGAPLQPMCADVCIAWLPGWGECVAFYASGLNHFRGTSIGQRHIRPPGLTAVQSFQRFSLMALSLLTNLSSLSAQRNVNNTQTLMANSVERLSSGMRINHASDDAAGLAISSKLGATLRGMKQAQRNANDAVSMIQTAEGGMGQLNNLLSRMRELAVESANGGTLGDSEREAVNIEYVALKDEIDRIVEVTSYNGATLLTGNMSAATFQIGAFNTTNDRLKIKIDKQDSTTLSINSSSVSTISTAQNAIDSLDKAIGKIANSRASIGAVQNRLATTIDNLSLGYNNLAAANSRIMDADVAEESAQMTRNNILLQAGISVLAQANAQPQAALSLLRG
jgi:flagellin